MRPAVKVARIAGASRHSRLETEPTSKVGDFLLIFFSLFVFCRYQSLSIVTFLRSYIYPLQGIMAKLKTVKILMFCTCATGIVSLLAMLGYVGFLEQTKKLLRAGSFEISLGQNKSSLEESRGDTNDNVCPKNGSEFGKHSVYVHNI